MLKVFAFGFALKGLVACFVIPGAQENAPVGRGEAVVLPPLQVVVIVQPLVHEVANIDGRYKVKVGPCNNEFSLTRGPSSARWGRQAGENKNKKTVCVWWGGGGGGGAAQGPSGRA